MSARRFTTNSPSMQFFILIIVVTFTGLSQGMLLPLLTIFLERMGVPSDLNALNATALYVGVFAMMFAVERILLRVGYKRMLLGGLIVVTAAIVLFPLLHNIYVWFVLRMIVGLGTARCITRLSCGRSPSARLTGADGIFRCTGWPMDLASASVRSALICSACMIPHRSW